MKGWKKNVFLIFVSILIGWTMFSLWWDFGSYLVSNIMILSKQGAFLYTTTKLFLWFTYALFTFLPCTFVGSLTSFGFYLTSGGEIVFNNKKDAA